MGVVQDMIAEEAKTDMTPMIDVVFLLLIFFMCMKFKSYEKKLDADLPEDEGLSISTPTPVQQLRITINLLAGETDKIQIMPDPLNEYFKPIQWREGSSGKREMFRELEEQIRRGFTYIGDKIEVAPGERVPFDYVALTLDAIHKAQERVPDEDKKNITFKAAPPGG